MSRSPTRGTKQQRRILLSALSTGAGQGPLWLWDKCAQGHKSQSRLCSEQRWLWSPQAFTTAWSVRHLQRHGLTGTVSLSSCRKGIRHRSCLVLCYFQNMGPKGLFGIWEQGLHRCILPAWITWQGAMDPSHILLMARPPDLAHLQMPAWKRKGSHSKQARKLAEGTLVRAVPLPACKTSSTSSTTTWWCVPWIIWSLGLSWGEKQRMAFVEMSCSLPPKGRLQGSLRRCHSVAGMAPEHVGCVRMLGPSTWGRLQRKLLMPGGLIFLPLRTWVRGG